MKPKVVEEVWSDDRNDLALISQHENGAYQYRLLRRASSLHPEREPWMPRASKGASFYQTQDDARRAAKSEMKGEPT